MRHYIRPIAAAIVQREKTWASHSGFAATGSAAPNRPGLVEELGELTWREIDRPR